MIPESAAVKCLTMMLDNLLIYSVTVAFLKAVALLKAVAFLKRSHTSFFKSLLNGNGLMKALYKINSEVRGCLIGLGIPSKETGNNFVQTLIRMSEHLLH